MALDLKTHRSDDGVRVAFEGELDISEAPRVERELKTLENERPARLILDLRNLSFMDSSGLRLIVAAFQRYEAEGRRLQIVPGPASIQRIFTVTRLDERLEFVDAPD